jgi:hypothetical protein
VTAAGESTGLPAGVAGFHLASLGIDAGARGRLIALFAYGTTALQLTQPFTPGCFLLTDLVGTSVELPAGGFTTLPLSVVAPPLGTEFRLQAAVVDALGVILTTNGLVITGP